MWFFAQETVGNEPGHEWVPPVLEMSYWSRSNSLAPGAIASKLTRITGFGAGAVVGHPVVGEPTLVFLHGTATAARQRCDGIETKEKSSDSFHQNS
ncbi:hypothetical protein [Hydrogenophaga sp.]|uniref:hypothetical protein n=1 Tax=Hydrogenophaga sp. TaxID=1904254 RepID=UPI0035B30667